MNADWPPLITHFVETTWPQLLGVISVTLALATSAHIALTKRNVHARAGWMAII